MYNNEYGSLLHVCKLVKQSSLFHQGYVPQRFCLASQPLLIMSLGAIHWIVYSTRRDINLHLPLQTQEISGDLIRIMKASVLVIARFPQGDHMVSILPRKWRTGDGAHCPWMNPMTG